MSEVLTEIEPGALEAVLADLRDGLAEHFAVEPEARVIDAGAPRASW
jgi:hypothetical protein